MVEDDEDSKLTASMTIGSIDAIVVIVFLLLLADEVVQVGLNIDDADACDVRLVEGVMIIAF